MSESDHKLGAIFRKHHAPTGSRPGTLRIPEGALPTEIRVWQYDENQLDERTLADVEELEPFVEPDRTTWIEVRGLADAHALVRLGELFSLNPLALADAVHAPQRAKSEPLPEHHLVVARLPMLDEEMGLMFPQLALFIFGRTLLTIQERYVGVLDPVRRRLREGKGAIRTAGPDYLAYALIDTLVDHYFPITEALVEELEILEEEALGDPGAEVLARIHQCRRKLVILRRVGRPQREAVLQLIRAPSPFISDEVRAYLQDTSDHIAQVVELVESCDELSRAVTETYLSLASHRANEIMRMLTVMASLFIPLTFVAGIYGMNFDAMPELHHRWGYPLALGVMLLVALGMLGYFRSRGWIGGRSRPRGSDRSGR